MLKKFFLCFVSCEQTVHSNIRFTAFSFQSNFYRTCILWASATLSRECEYFSIAHKIQYLLNECRTFGKHAYKITFYSLQQWMDFFFSFSSKKNKKKREKWQHFWATVHDMHLSIKLKSIKSIRTMKLMNGLAEVWNSIDSGWNTVRSFWYSHHLCYELQIFFPRKIILRNISSFFFQAFGLFSHYSHRIVDYYFCCFSLKRSLYLVTLPNGE